jgi:hypothetical protein
MTPPGPRPRKQRPTHDGAPASQSDGTSSSAPVTTPTHTPTGGMTATSTTYIQVHGNTVRAQSVRTGFNFGGANLLSNANVPIRYKLQATRMCKFVLLCRLKVFVLTPLLISKRPARA